MDRSMKQKLFRPLDAVWIGVMIFLCLLGLFLFRSRPKAQEAVLLSDNHEIARFSLAEDCLYTPEECPGVTIEVSDGAIRFLVSDCPDQICVQSGFLSRAGEYAVCLPHHLVLKITDADPDAPDAVTGGLKG